MRNNKHTLTVLGLAVFLVITNRVVSAQTPPFHQCPAVGLDSGCAILLVIEKDGSLRVKTDPSQPPYDGIEDTLIGVQNNSDKTVASIPLKSTTDIFGFDGDGICTVSPRPGGCPVSRTPKCAAITPVRSNMGSRYV